MRALYAGVVYATGDEVELHSGDIITCGGTTLSIFIRPPPPAEAKPKSKRAKKPKAMKDPTGQSRQLVLEYRKYIFTPAERGFMQ
eukprot:SAG11_NODE_1028_length_6123_cov_1.537517_3_plen_85_part_00